LKIKNKELVLKAFDTLFNERGPKDNARMQTLDQNEADR
jgi:hypothetical protein